MANDYEKFKTNAIAYVVEFAQFADTIRKVSDGKKVSEQKT